MKPLPGQASLFPAPLTGRDVYDEPPAVPLNSSVESEDESRLSRKSAEVLARLEQGPAWFGELLQICPSFGQRLHEMKSAGIAWDKKRGGAVYLYFLERHRDAALAMIGDAAAR